MCIAGGFAWHVGPGFESNNIKQKQIKQTKIKQRKQKDNNGNTT